MTHALLAFPDHILIFSCSFFPLSNDSVVPTILIKIDAQAQIEQQELVGFMNTTLEGGMLGRYQVDPSSVQISGTLKSFFVFTYFCPCAMFFSNSLINHQVISKEMITVTEVLISNLNEHIF